MNLYIKAIGFEQVDSDFEEQMIHAGILDSLEKIGRASCRERV